MKRSDIIRTLQVQYKGMRTDDAMAMLDAVTNEMINAIAKNNRIEIRGFGTFQPRKRATKDGYNPSTGKMMHLDAGRTILFKPSRELTKKMNGSKKWFQE
ncbi:MAG: integration host factor subunit beta [Alphaproteobacteria bacterium]|nr:integration host factor subunit beta [Alphaproteobacteria bacterium]